MFISGDFCAIFFCMKKEDYIWLERNTEIVCTCKSLEECAVKDVKFKVYRENHLKHLRQIFKDCPLKMRRDRKDGLPCLTVKGFTVDNFYDIALENNAALVLDTTAKKVHYISADKDKNRRIFRKSSAKLLANLPNRKKLNILYAFSTSFFTTEEQDNRLTKTITRNADKFNALLQLKFPKDFVRDEIKKIDEIVEEIAGIPQIKRKLSGFCRLSFPEQKKLMDTVCRLTAEKNGIPEPKTTYLTQKEMAEQDSFAKWLDTDAFTSERDIFFNKERFSVTSGIESLSMAFHETCHIAQMYADYKQFPEMEEILGAKLLYLSSYEETYLSSPQEMLAYQLEKEFIQQMEKQLKMKNRQNFYESEYAETAVFLHKALRRAY